MAGAEIPGRLSWLAATVTAKKEETPRVVSIVFECPGWDGHTPGQHVDIRLTAEDGYQAQRSYSIASSPEDDHLLLTVERLQDGEVSPYLFDELRPGDQLEMRGSIGGYFAWDAEMEGPVLMVAGGSGVVPFRAMLRHRVHNGSDVPMRLLYSSRSVADVIYRDELSALSGHDGIEVLLTLTRERPDGWELYDRRIDREMLEEVAWSLDRGSRTYVCGPTGFVETAANLLVGLGHEPGSIRTERFGPTG